MGCYYLLNESDIIMNFEICFIVLPLHIPITKLLFIKYGLIAKYTHVFCMPYDSIYLYECILTAFCSRAQSGVLTQHAHLAVRFLYLLTS